MPDFCTFKAARSEPARPAAAGYPASARFKFPPPGP
jgi:hypothetical protein